MYKDNILALWKDKKIVGLLSNYYKNEEINKEAKYGKPAKIIPKCIEQYTKFKGSIDKMDQMLSYYAFSNRFGKWYRKVFVYLLDITLYNSYILYNRDNKEISFLDFRKCIVDDLLRKYIIKVNNIDKNINHFPYVDENKNRGDCSFCKSQFQKRTRIIYKCKACNKYLCPEICFEKYHNDK